MEPSYDVAVIGGGIAGCASAYFLARKGLKVILLEKGRIAGEQSGRNWGFVRQQGRDPREIPLMMACNRIWRGLEAELEADLEWRQGGLLYMAEDAARIASYEGWLTHARDFQLDSRLLSAGEAAALAPGMVGTWAGALYTPSDGQADPIKTTNAFADAARRLGARVRTGCVVEAVENAGGAVTGVRTEAGPVRAARVLVAAGAWTSRFLRPLGADLPQLYTRASVLRTTRAAPGALRPGVWSHNVGLRQRRDGSFNVALGRRSDFDVMPDAVRYFRAFWPNLRRQHGHINLRLGRESLEGVRLMLGGPGTLARRMKRDRVLSPAPNRRAMGRALSAFRALFPAQGALGIADSWAGVIEATPDDVPVLDAVPGVRGLAVATGFSGHGFGLGPIAGRVMAETIADGKPSLDLGAFRFQRFANVAALDRDASV
ncbi:MAG: NAD(P)/FAD-dependent oxidoreductase [Kiloniellaceae bacterium]